MVSPSLFQAHIIRLGTHATLLDMGAGTVWLLLHQGRSLSPGSEFWREKLVSLNFID